MTAGTWFVLCDRARAIPVAELATQLADLYRATVRLDGDALAITAHDELTGRDADVTVGLSTAPHVKIESAEIGVGADARYELVFDLRATDELLNTLLAVAHRIAKLTDGVVYDVDGAARV